MAKGAARKVKGAIVGLTLLGVGAKKPPKKEVMPAVLLDFEKEALADSRDRQPGQECTSDPDGVLIKKIALTAAKQFWNAVLATFCDQESLNDPAKCVYSKNALIDANQVTWFAGLQSHKGESVLNKLKHFGRAKGFVAKLNDQGDRTRCVVSLGGSTSWQNWGANIRAGPTNYTKYTKDVSQSSVGGVSNHNADGSKPSLEENPIMLDPSVEEPTCDDCRVHSGLQSSYAQIEEQIVTSIESLQCSDLVIAGYSSGGAIATYLAFNVLHNMSVPGKMYNILESLTVWTYGAPRVGNMGFVKEFDRRAKQVTDVATQVQGTRNKMFNMYRVVNECDIMPETFGKLYKHVVESASEVYTYINKEETCVCVRKKCVHGTKPLSPGCWPHVASSHRKFFGIEWENTTVTEDHKKEGKKGSAATSVASQEGEGSAKTSKAKKADTAAVPAVAAGGVGSALQTSGGGNTKKESKKGSAATTDAAKEQEEDDFSFSNVEAYAENFGKLAEHAQESIEKAKGQVGDTFKSNQELVDKVKELLGGKDGTGIKKAEKLADMIREQVKNSTTG